MNKFTSSEIGQSSKLSLAHELSALIPERWTEAGRCGRSSQHTAEIRVNAPILPRCFELVRPSFLTRNYFRQGLGNREIRGRLRPDRLSVADTLRDCNEPERRSGRSRPRISR